MRLRAQAYVRKVQTLRIVREIVAVMPMTYVHTSFCLQNHVALTTAFNVKL